jgi:hypothetical protein
VFDVFLQSVEDVSRVRCEDLPRGLTLEVDVPVNLGSVDATLYVERGVVELYVDVDWSYWSYAVSKGEFVDRLTKRLEKLGYSVEASEDGVKASMTCSGKLSQYLEDLVEGIDNVSGWNICRIYRCGNGLSLPDDLEPWPCRFNASLKSVLESSMYPFFVNASSHRGLYHGGVG